MPGTSENPLPLRCVKSVPNVLSCTPHSRFGEQWRYVVHPLLINQMFHCSYGLKLWLLSIDEGISGYRDDSLETVKRNEEQYGIPLKVLSYKDLYGWSMDEIVKQIGTKNNCTFCGVFRRQALDRGATMLGANKVVTGHNADDIAETVLLNILRGDLPRYVLSIPICSLHLHFFQEQLPFAWIYPSAMVQISLKPRRRNVS